MLLRQVWIAVGLLISACVVSAASAPGSPARAWRPEDSVELQYLFDPKNDNGDPWVPGARLEDYLQISPSGRHFFFGTRRGDLSCDCVHYTLMVFGTSQVKAELLSKKKGSRPPLQPMRTATLSSALSNRSSAIRYAHWESDSLIVFTGYDEQARTSVYELDIDSGKLRQVLAIAPEAWLNGYASSGGTTAYLSSRSPPPRPPDSHYPVWALEGDIREWLSGREFQHSIIELSIATGDGPPRTRVSYSLPWRSSPFPAQPAVAKSGRWVVVAVPAYENTGSVRDGTVSMPEGWERYEGLDQSIKPLDMSSLARLWRYVIVDAVSGEVRTMLDAPRGPVGAYAIGNTSPVIWSDDSRHVALTNVGLPLAATANDRLHASYVVVYDASTGKWNALAPMSEAEIPVASASGAGGAESSTRRVHSVAWVSDSQLEIRYLSGNNAPAGRVTYTLAEGSWQKQSSSDPGAASPKTPAASRKELADGVQVLLRESDDNPATLVATSGQREVTLLAADPVLGHIWRAPTRTVRWTERDGHAEAGQLLLPRSVPKGTRLPLVVQLEALSPGNFLPDGASSTAFAAQALAAEGFAVLRLDSRVGFAHPQVKEQRGLELPLILERVDSAVHQVDMEGLIDPARVGLIGFSRTGFLVSYIISHTRGFVPAAAIVADSTTGNYGEYLHSESYVGISVKPITTRGMEELYGGTFWQNKQKWLEEAPAFNIDRIETPALFTYNGSDPEFMSSPIMELLTGYRLNNRAIDVQLFSGGAHQLQRPVQRLASLRLSVDWMAFWLQDREIARPESTQQYRYWRSLREQQAARQHKHN